MMNKSSAFSSIISVLLLFLCLASFTTNTIMVVKAAEQEDESLTSSSNMLLRRRRAATTPTITTACPKFDKTTGLESLQIPAFYVSFTTGNVTTSQPTYTQYDLLKNKTASFLLKTFQVNDAKFPKVKYVNLRILQYGFNSINKPDKTYQIYVSFCTNIVFQPNVKPTSTTLTQAFDKISKNIVLPDYLLKYVRMIPKSPFTNVVGLSYGTL